MDHHEKRSCGCVLLHRRVYVCEKHSQLPESMRDRISELLTKTMAEQIEAACSIERKKCSEVLREALKLARFVIQNRGCGCNEPNHRCGTNQMLADVATLEERLP